MDAIATTTLAFGLISTIATMIGAGSRLLSANAARRRRIGFDDWKLEMQSHDGKVWFRDYLKDLQSDPHRGRPNTKEAGA